MKSYTQFLKANNSLLEQFNSIAGLSTVKVAAGRLQLPDLFAEEFNKCAAQQIRWVVTPEWADAQIRIAPLEKRRGDIPDLLKYFFPWDGLSLPERRSLLTWAWPDDLMEMQQLGVVRAANELVDVRDYLGTPADTLLVTNTAQYMRRQGITSLIRDQGLKPVIDKLADQLLWEEVENNGGSIAAAARALKVAPTTLYSRLALRQNHSGGVSKDQKACA